MIRSLARRLPFFYGWVIVGCTMCSSVVRQTAAVATLSIFLVPMTDGVRLVAHRHLRRGVARR